MSRFIEIELFIRDNPMEEQEDNLPFRVVWEGDKPKPSEYVDKQLKTSKVLIDINSIEYIGQTYKEGTCTINGEFLVNETYEHLKNRILKMEAENK